MPKRMTWREEHRRLDAFLASSTSTDAALPVADTARRVARKRKKARAVEYVFRWRERHPKTFTRRRRMQYQRRKRKLTRKAVWVLFCVRHLNTIFWLLARLSSRRAFPA